MLRFFEFWNFKMSNFKISAWDFLKYEIFRKPLDRSRSLGNMLGPRWFPSAVRSLISIDAFCGCFLAAQRGLVNFKDLSRNFKISMLSVFAIDWYLQSLTVAQHCNAANDQWYSVVYPLATPHQSRPLMLWMVRRQVIGPAAWLPRVGKGHAE